LLERARERTAAEGLHSVVYELGDAQVHPFVPRQFDVVISRFGTMFFADPVAAFSHIAHRETGRLTSTRLRAMSLVGSLAAQVGQARGPGVLLVPGRSGRQRGELWP